MNGVLSASSDHFSMETEPFQMGVSGSTGFGMEDEEMSEMERHAMDADENTFEDKEMDDSVLEMGLEEEEEPKEASTQEQPQLEQGEDAPTDDAVEKVSPENDQTPSVEKEPVEERTGGEDTKIIPISEPPKHESEGAQVRNQSPDEGQAHAAEDEDKRQPCIDRTVVFNLLDKSKFRLSNFGKADSLDVDAVEISSSSQTLENFLFDLRDQHLQSLSQDEELVLVFSELGLTITEDNCYCREISLTDVLDLHEPNENDPIEVGVRTQSRFITRYNTLVSSYGSAQLLNEIPYIAEESSTERGKSGTEASSAREDSKLAGSDQTHFDEEATVASTLEGPDDVETKSGPSGLAAQGELVSDDGEKQPPQEALTQHDDRQGDEGLDNASQNTTNEQKLNPKNGFADVDQNAASPGYEDLKDSGNDVASLEGRKQVDDDYVQPSGQGLEGEEDEEEDDTLESESLPRYTEDDTAEAVPLPPNTEISVKEIPEGENGDESSEPTGSEHHGEPEQVDDAEDSQPEPRHGDMDESEQQQELLPNEEGEEYTGDGVAATPDAEEIVDVPEEAEGSSVGQAEQEAFEKETDEQEAANLYAGEDNQTLESNEDQGSLNAEIDGDGSRFQAGPLDHGFDRQAVFSDGQDALGPEEVDGAEGQVAAEDAQDITHEEVRDKEGDIEQEDDQADTNNGLNARSNDSGGGTQPSGSDQNIGSKRALESTEPQSKELKRRKS